MPFEVQKAAIKDLVAIVDLVNSGYRGDASKQGWTTEADLLDGSRTTVDLLEEIITRPGTTVLVHFSEGNLAACVELRQEGDSMYLGMLTVKPTLQSRGLGKNMLKASEEFARAQNCKSINMTVISIRTELVDWYIRHGYVDTGKRKPFILPDTRWGVPKYPLEFMVLEKNLN